MGYKIYLKRVLGVKFRTIYFSAQYPNEMFRPMYVELLVLSWEVPVKAGLQEPKLLKADYSLMSNILMNNWIQPLFIGISKRDSKLNFPLMFKKYLNGPQACFVT